jgi:hypothetical protein
MKIFESEESIETKELQELLDFTDAKKGVILSNIVNSIPMYNSIDISSDVYKDTGIDKWCSVLPKLEGSKLLIKRIIYNPINNLNILEDRQKSYDVLRSAINIDLEKLQDYEDDVLWIYKLNDEIQTNNLIYALFPSTFIISYINYINPILELYQIYKIYITPLTILLYPIITLLAPLYYLRKFLHINLSISSYISMLYNIFKVFISFSGGVKTVLAKIITIVFYIFIFTYNIYQTLEYCYLLYGVRDTLYKKISNLNIFLKTATDIINSLPAEITSPFIVSQESIGNMSLSNNMTNIYKIWKDPYIKSNISTILHTIYTIDIIYSISQLNWCNANYESHSVKIWNMKNPLLHNKQTPNPVNLSKNIVITGPNAAGKTTYVKSILSNIILAHTFGICYAQKADIVLYDSISSFMRISDVLGSKSYFEVEAEYCSRMMKKANELSKENKKTLFLMDEPMHSTPPTEGMSTAFAVAEYIGNLPKTNIIITTHFHKLISLAEIYSDKFINLCVEAIPKEKGFYFPYTIKNGYSHQCIAIELLSSKDFPESVIQSAINMKNKIYHELNST